MSSRTPIRLLMMAVVQEQDVEKAIRAAKDLGARAVHLTSTGGFLGRRNATLLIGMPEGLEDRFADSLRRVCRRRIEYMTMAVEGAPLPLPAPIPVTVGGATVFALPVERFEEI